MGFGPMLLAHVASLPHMCISRLPTCTRQYIAMMSNDEETDHQHDDNTGTHNVHVQVEIHQAGDVGRHHTVKHHCRGTVGI